MATTQTWNVTADPERFDEAVEWFLKRVPVLRNDLATIDEHARDRAFWITGLAQLEIVSQAHKSLEKAIADGTPFEEWKQSLSTELRTAWGNASAHRLRLVYRNATQQALIAGRWAQINEPNVKRFRPYGLFDGIGDRRQTAICKACDGTILPLDHDWWQTHTPQLHHACRSSVRTLRTREALRRGVTNPPPTDSADRGFGAPPRLDGAKPIPKPDTAPALKQEFDRKQAEGPKKKSLIQRILRRNPDHDPARWESIYAQRYDKDAVKPIAWGRAMTERGLDMDLTKARKRLEALNKAGFPAAKEALALIRTSSVRRGRFRDVVAQKQTYKHVLEGAAGLIGHTDAITRHKQSVLGSAIANQSSKPRSILQAAQDLLQQLLDSKVLSPETYRYAYAPNGRAYHDGTAKEIAFRDDVPVLLHEIAHGIEAINAKAGKAALAFLTSRTRGEKAERLSALTNKGYDPAEVAKPDKFLDPYVGKIYPHGATEVSSMAIEMSVSTGFKVQRLLERDPELFYFVLGQLAGHW